jgi:hypothetical protein
MNGQKTSKSMQRTTREAEKMTEKYIYAQELIRALKLQVHCMAQAAQIVDPSIKLEKIEVCGSLGDFLKGERERFRTPLDLCSGRYSDIDVVLTFNKPDEKVAEVLAKTEAQYCPCVYMPRIGVHEFVWNLPSHSPCKPEERVTV